MPPEARRRGPGLTSNQVRGFWAAWGGWALDGMDSFIYALVMVPALSDLLPASGLAANQSTVGYYGSALFALFLIGWGASLVWGPLADRFGRVRTLSLTILCYSIFTALSAFSTRVWHLAILRLLAGVGIGGEWSMGATFVAEEWPEERRKTGAGWMHTGYYFGFFLAAFANSLVGARLGWRAMFVLGGAPALLVGFIRRGVQEPARWEQERGAREGSRTMRRAFFQLFSHEFRRRTALNSIYVLVSIAGLWAGSVYVPAAVTYLALGSGHSAESAARLASTGTAVLAAGTIVGCVVLPALAERLGRRATLGLYFAVMLASIAFSFGYAFYLPAGALGAFMVCLVFLGFGGASFAMYTLWLPEQYPTECRASAFAFATSFGRFLGAAITFLVGAGVAHYQTLGLPVAMTSLAFAVGLALVPFGLETRGKPLPA